MGEAFVEFNARLTFACPPHGKPNTKTCAVVPSPGSLMQCRLVSLSSSHAMKDDIFKNKCASSKTTALSTSAMKGALGQATAPAKPRVLRGPWWSSSKTCLGKYYPQS